MDFGWKDRIWHQFWVVGSFGVYELIKKVSNRGHTGWTYRESRTLGTNAECEASRKNIKLLCNEQFLKMVYIIAKAKISIIGPICNWHIKYTKIILI